MKGRGGSEVDGGGLDEYGGEANDEDGLEDEGGKLDGDWDWWRFEEEPDDLDGDWSGLEENVGGNGIEVLELWETSLVLVWIELWTCCGLTVRELLIPEDWGRLEEDADGLDGV